MREIFVGKSYRLIYRVKPSTVSIIAFIHTARDLAAYVRRQEEEE